jgi:hypothetical protein
MYGMLVGSGFEMTENFGYFLNALFLGDPAMLSDMIIVRAIVFGFGHALLTGITGAALGWVRAERPTGVAKVLAPMAGLGAAMLLHSIWNGGAIMVAAVQSQLGTESLLTTGGVNGLFFLPLAIIVIVVLRGAMSNAESRMVRRQLGFEVDQAVLTRRELDVLADRRHWWQLAWIAYRQGGGAALAPQRRFRSQALHLAYRLRDAELAWTKSGRRYWPGVGADLARIRALRRELGLQPGPGPADMARPVTLPAMVPRGFAFRRFVALTGVLDALTALGLQQTMRRSHPGATIDYPRPAR